MAINWENCARELGRSLSRYNGLTNSAKLDLIDSVVRGGMFDQRPFCYAYELIGEFGKEVAQRSAEVHMQHAMAFGFLHRAVPGMRMLYKGTMLESGSHIALAPLGRSLRSISALKEDGEDFRLFLWSYALLECDFDMYGLLVKMTAENDGDIVSRDKFNEKFKRIQQQRLAWMKDKFPYASHRGEIQKSVQWVGNRVKIGEDEDGKDKYRRVFALDNIFTFMGQTPAHHFNQRKKWMKILGHINEDGQKITDLGKQLAGFIPGLDSDPFFWLGPTKECAEARIISGSKIPDKCYSPAWNLLRPASLLESEAIRKEFVKRIVDYMCDAFEQIRLYRFNQASLDMIVPYVYFLERKYGGRVDEHEFFQEVLMMGREKLSCSLQRNLSQSHYRLREKT